MSGIVYPRPLAPGDLIAVPAPSSGVPAELHERLAAAVTALEARGFRADVGELALRGGLVPAPAAVRAEELTAAFARPEVRAVLPPWGGDLAIDLVDRIDWAALAADPTWFAGWSDISTLLMPLTILTGVATLHGANLMDEPWQLPEEFVRWTDVASAPAGATIEQRSAPRRRSRVWGAWAAEPLGRDEAYEEPTRWRLLGDGDGHGGDSDGSGGGSGGGRDGDRDGSGAGGGYGGGELRVRGRLIGGCLETVSLLAGSPAGDVRGFAERHAPEGLIVYLEVSDADAVTAARLFHSLRLAGWFERANAVLIGRTSAEPGSQLSHRDAVRMALGDLGIPVILDVDAGHQPPQMPLVNGALAEVVLLTDGAVIRQYLVP
jgi:muramoyltetrapeptide carboxypeptidase